MTKERGKEGRREGGTGEADMKKLGTKETDDNERMKRKRKMA